MDLTSLIEHILCPPGNGVHTVHTAQELKDEYHTALYGDAKSVQEHWKKSLKKLDKNQLPILFGITSDSGGGIQRGANWGPLFIRRELLDISKSFFDIGDTKTIPHFLHDKYLNAETIKRCQTALYDGKDLPVSPLSIAQYFTEQLYKNQKEAKLLTLGGDHSVSYPVCSEWIKAKRSNSKNVAIIHFDAHTDLMENRLGVDICFASWAFKMIELLEKPSDLIQFGIRSSGQSKEHWESKLGIKQFWNYDFESLGAQEIAKQTIDYLTQRNCDEVYISFDIDFLDASFASATGTPEDGGLGIHDAVTIIESIGEKFKVTGADLVEVAPFVSSYKKKATTLEPFTTLQSSKLLINCILEQMEK